MAAQSPVVALGVTGSIAAYKAAELASSLTQEGYEVHVVLTVAGARFVTPITFQTLTHQPVVTDLFHPDAATYPRHTALAERAGLLVVAPATADFLGKMACGLADDALSTLYLAVTCPVLVAPAMNDKMWKHPAVVENVRRLRDRGVGFVSPEAGMLACGVEGEGRLAAPETIAAEVRRRLPIA